MKCLPETYPVDQASGRAHLDLRYHLVEPLEEVETREQLDKLPTNWAALFLFQSYWMC